MRATLVILATLCMPCLLAAPVPPKKGNLLVNGSFEEGPEVGDCIPLNPGSEAIKGWVVTRGQIDLVGTAWPAAHRARSLDLHGPPGFGGVKQTFKTRPGRIYAVAFSLAANPINLINAPKVRVGVAAAEESAEFEFDRSGRTAKDMGWERKAWRFTATRAETTLEIYTLLKDNAFSGPALDDVSV